MTDQEWCDLMRKLARRVLERKPTPHEELITHRFGLYRDWFERRSFYAHRVEASGNADAVRLWELLTAAWDAPDAKSAAEWSNCADDYMREHEDALNPLVGAYSPKG